MKIAIKTYIADDSSIPFMGPGPVRLLECIDQLRSINKAAKRMSLSYVKALNMLNRLEKCLDEKMINRKRGGNERGGASLTPFAERYIRFFKGLEEKIDGYAKIEFQEFLREMKEEQGHENGTD